VKRFIPASALIVLCGVVAAMHVGKLPPAVPALRDAFGLSLVQSGFLLSIVLLAGLSLALLLGSLAHAAGLRRCMLVGLLVLMVGSGAGAWAGDAVQLMGWRALEGLGFLLVSLSAPSLIRRHVSVQRLPLAMGWWGAYVPLGSALALLIGPWVMQASSWQVWWTGLALLALASALLLAWSIPADAPRHPSTRALAGKPDTPEPASGHEPPAAWSELLHQTLTSRGPWLVALTFCAYSCQWLAIIGFLPSIYAQSGLDMRSAGALTAVVSLVNMVGNVASGILLRRGVAPRRLLLTGFACMASGAWLAFNFPELPPPARYAAIVLFSGVGGMIPGTLFNLAVQVALSPQAVAPTVGWLMQWSCIGQFAGPPLVAWVAQTQGNWNQTWWVTGTACLVGVFLAHALTAKRSH
jgi:CP family cyanate transporter-like MFS transporter